MITDINISVTNGNNAFIYESSAGTPVDAIPAPNVYTDFLLDPGGGSSPNYTNFITLGDGVSSSRLYGCLAPTATPKYAWSAASGGTTLPKGGFSLGPNPVSILQVVAAGGTLGTTLNPATNCPRG